MYRNHLIVAALSLALASALSAQQPPRAQDRQHYADDSKEEKSDRKDKKEERRDARKDDAREERRDDSSASAGGGAAPNQNRGEQYGRDRSRSTLDPKDRRDDRQAAEVESQRAPRADGSLRGRPEDDDAQRTQRQIEVQRAHAEQNPQMPNRQPERSSAPPVRPVEPSPQAPTRQSQRDSPSQARQTDQRVGPDRQTEQRRSERGNDRYGLGRGDQRLSDRQQQENIQRQRQNVSSYRLRSERQQAGFARDSRQLQQQNRNAQYRYQQQYFRRLADQQTRYRNTRHDYNNDPYYYTASIYRYSRAGRTYQTNRYGADLFRQAANFGYQEGFQAGLADQRDNWKFSFRDSYIYQDANFGYDGYYVSQDDYNYYFRAGFEKGYDDGFYGRAVYGRRSNDSYNMLDSVLVTLLGLSALN